MKYSLVFLLIFFHYIFPGSEIFSSNIFADKVISKGYDKTGIEDIIAYHTIIDSIKKTNIDRAVKLINSFSNSHPISPFSGKVKRFKALCDYHQISWGKIFKEKHSISEGEVLLDYLLSLNETNRTVKFCEKLILNFPKNNKLIKYIPMMEKYYAQTNVKISPYNAIVMKKKYIYNYAWLIYKYGYYNKSITLYKKLQKDLYKKDVFYYIATAYYCKAKYKSAVKYYEKFLAIEKRFSKKTSSVLHWSHYYYIRSLEKTGNYTTAYNKMRAFTSNHKVLSYYQVLVRLAKKTKGVSKAKIEGEFAKYFPYHSTSYRINKEKGLDSLAKNEYKKGLSYIKNVYGKRKDDYNVFRSLVLDKNLEHSYMSNRSYYYDYFFKDLGLVTNYPKIKKILSEVDTHNSNVLVTIGLSNRTDLVTNLIKPLYIDRDDLKKDYLVKSDIFFSNYYLHPYIYKSNEYYRRLKVLTALDYESIARKEIYKKFKSNEFLKYTYLTYLYNNVNKFYKAAIESIKIVNRRKAGLIPYDFLRKAYPVYMKDKILYLTKKHKVPFEFAYAIMREESRFHETALSWAGARGLMQIMTSTGKAVYKNTTYKQNYKFNLFDPDLNIQLGLKYITDLFRRYDNNLIYTAAAYNAGPGNVKKWQKRKPETIIHFALFITYKETEKYLKKVLESYIFYKNLYQNL